jgi:hypothetical protein
VAPDLADCAWAGVLALARAHVGDSGGQMTPEALRVPAWVCGEGEEDDDPGWMYRCEGWT